MSRLAGLTVGGLAIGFGLFDVGRIGG